LNLMVTLEQWLSWCDRVRKVEGEVAVEGAFGLEGESALLTLRHGSCLLTRKELGGLYELSDRQVREWG
jgi:hypothetical protein